MSLGSDLSQARERAGVTLAEASERTRIRQTVIARIEADDFSLCGGDVYARGHIRTLAKVAGIDPEPLVAEFDRLNATQAPSAADVFEADTPTVDAERHGPNWTAAMAAAVVVLLAIAGFQLLRGGNSGAPATAGGASSPTLSSPAAPHSSAAAPSTSAPPASVAPPTSSAVAQVPSRSSGVTVRLTVSGGKSWVSATAGGTNVYEGLLSSGASKTFTDAKQVKVVIGNAAAVHLVVNGYDLGSPGGRGQVVRLTFGPGDPTGSG